MMSLSSPLRWLLSVVGGTLLWAQPQKAQAQEEDTKANIWIDASSRSSCEEMEGLPMQAREIALGLPEIDWRPDIYFAMERIDGAAQGRVAVRYLGEQLFEKELSARSCHDVIAALLLSLQIYVDGVTTDDLARLEEKEESVRARAAPPGWPGPDLDPFELSPTEGDPFGRNAPRRLRLFNLRPALYVGLVRGWNVLPNSTWGGTGVEVSGSIPLDEDVGFDGGARYLTSSPLYVDGYRYRFASTSFFLGPSRAWRVSDTLTLRLNFTAVLTLIHASVSNDASRADSPPFGSFGTGLNAALSYNPVGGLIVEARFGGQAMSLNGVYLSPTGETVWEQPLLGAIGGISVGWGGEKIQQKRRFVGDLSNFEFSDEGLPFGEQ